MCSVHLKHILVIFRGHLPHHLAILVGGGYPPGTNARRSRCETDLGARFCKVTLVNQLKTLVIGPLVNNSTTSLFDPGSCLPRWNLSRAKRLKSCVPRAKSGPLLVFVNKVLSEHSRARPFARRPAAPQARGELRSDHGLPPASEKCLFITLLLSSKRYGEEPRFSFISGN